MKISKETVIRHLKLQLGIVLLTVGVYFFKSPNRFATGGVSGLSILLAKLIPALTQAQHLLILNAALLILGAAVLGKECGIMTAFCTLEYSLLVRLLERVMPLDGPLTSQTFMELFYSVILSGIAAAIIFDCDASSGGTDIIALILKKYTRLNVGTALLISDALIAVSNFFINGVEAGLYSVLGLFAKGFLVDSVIDSLNTGKAFTIITDKPDEIAAYAINVLHRGVTCYNATGMYTGEERTVLLIVCHRTDAIKMRLAARRIDPSSFTVVTNSSEIIGRGFLSE